MTLVTIIHSNKSIKGLPSRRLWPELGKQSFWVITIFLLIFRAFNRVIRKTATLGQLSLHKIAPPGHI